jgi:hypothetical protein
VAKERQTKGIVARAREFNFLVTVLGAVWVAVSAMGALALRSYQSFGVGNAALLAVAAALLGIWGIPRIFERVCPRRPSFREIVASLIAGLLVLFVWAANQLPTLFQAAPTAANNPSINQPTQTASPRPQSSSASRYYSSAEREELANRISSISVILNKDLPDIASQWEHMSGVSLDNLYSREDVATVLDRVDQLHQTTKAIRTKLWNDAVNGNPRFFARVEEFAWWG